MTLDGYLLSAICVAVAYPVGVFVGRFREHRRLEPDLVKMARYHFGVEALSRWCGHESKEAHLIAQHLKALGTGAPMNAGTPIGDEACTIEGLREQLRRTKATRCAR